MPYDEPLKIFSCEATLTGMDLVKAHELEALLKGRAIDGWVIEKYVNHGKSAAVFAGRKGGDVAAVKIFDRELIEKYGDKVQLARIQREKDLSDRIHENMVRIYGGGFDGGTESHYIIMGFVEGNNLAEMLPGLPYEKIPSLISQLASAAEFLESLGLVHRDIKPENIIISPDYDKLVLIDFGVLRPIGDGSLTDGDGIQSFVGTLQYSSPEFLLRKEEDDLPGWRALTIYQIGGVLHDMIMKRPLFNEFKEPYARLVLAVQNTVPEIQSSFISPDLVDLAACCLLKDWRARLQLVDWSRFHRTGAQAGNHKERVTERLALQKAKAEDTIADHSANAEREAKAFLVSTVNLIKIALRSTRNDNVILPPLVVTAQTSGERALVKAYLRDSEEYRLPVGLTLLISVKVLDPFAKALTIEGSARLGKWNPTEALPSPDQWQAVYKGIHAGDAIYKKIEEFVYCAIDKAQVSDHSLPAGQGWLALDVDGGV